MLSHDRRTIMKVSARNLIPGKVKEITVGAVTGEAFRLAQRGEACSCAVGPCAARRLKKF